jgi:hypothetical protein
MEGFRERQVVEGEGDVLWGREVITLGQLWEVTQMVKNRNQPSGRMPVKRARARSPAEANQIGACRPFSFAGKNLTKQLDRRAG